jgi:iron(III) transport system substrate-binding protein
MGEGKVSVVTPPGDTYRTVFEAFQKKYGITVEPLPNSGTNNLVARLSTERQVGQFNWDVIAHSPGNMINGLKPMGALDPLRPALILPEVLDDEKWAGGFAAGWADVDQSLIYSFTAQRLWTVRVNRDVIPESQLNSVDQLWDPQWKGKIAMQDPRVPSAGVEMASTWLLAKGDSRLRAFFESQQPVLTEDRRQLAEWLIRGQYPIALASAPEAFAPYSSQGLSLRHITALMSDDPAAAMLTNGTGAVSLINHAPRPNAARVFINWALSQEGQTAYAQVTNYNSRRLDVAVVDPDALPDPNKQYTNLNTEATYPMRNKAIEIANEVLR